MGSEGKTNREKAMECSRLFLLIFLHAGGGVLKSCSLNIRQFWQRLEEFLHTKRLTFDRAVSSILSPIVDMATVTDMRKVTTTWAIYSTSFKHSCLHRPILELDRPDWDAKLNPGSGMIQQILKYTDDKLRWISNESNDDSVLIRNHVAASHVVQWALTYFEAHVRVQVFKLLRHTVCLNARELKYKHSED